MLKGIGIDIVDIGKIKRIIETRKEKFYSRVFSKTEVIAIENVRKKNEKRGFQKAAGYFAAKEAFLKAAGKGLFSIPLNKITIFNGEEGRPYIRLELETEINGVENFFSAHVSITHDKGFACAVVAVQ